ncbi:hypothetical protein GKE82_07290 [Conexibacter sp. W3-3-2]|uniref:hypothetical protein n=1 Tax=Conexibacter sp. W3-3-2 TaxID=2675227 RepID=UPI0012B823BD|nr:hypothetical protein [Conexibacter sp. W3-3-2]MTD44111.1 hypothetical protein [Conexibacter sp. W3-3-2]
MRTTPLAAAAAILLTLPAVAGAATRDRNDDGIPDSWEKRHKLALVAGQDARDQDHDGLTNLVEWQAGTNPRRRDSDRDGRPDGREDSDRDGLRNRFEGPTGHDAGEADTDDDGVKDGREGAGRVRRVSGTTVTIDLGGGRTARATVTDETVSRCGTADDWLSGVLDLPLVDDLADEAGDAVGDVVELVDEVLPALRSAGAEDDGSGDDGTPVDVPFVDLPADGAPVEDVPTEDAPTDEGDAADTADEDACPDGAVQKGTWLHASGLEDGTFAWLDVVSDEQD